MTLTAQVRDALPDDAWAFTACHVACWREAYPALWGAERLEQIDEGALAADRRREIAAGIAHYVVAEHHGEIIGIAIAGPARDEDAPEPLELYAIYLRAAHYGTGIGQALLAAALAGQPATLWTYRDNPRACAFYVNHGFIPDGAERQDSSGLIELRMTRTRAVPR